MMMDDITLAYVYGFGVLALSFASGVLLGHSVFRFPFVLLFAVFDIMVAVVYIIKFGGV